MTSLPPDLFSSPPRSLSVSSRFFPVSIRSLSVSTRASSLRPCSGLFTPPPRLLSVAVAVPSLGVANDQWPDASCEPRHESLGRLTGILCGRLSRQASGTASLQVFPVRSRGGLSASLSSQVSWQPLCQPFPASRWAAYFANLSGHPLRSPFSSSLWASSLSISPPTFSGNFSCQVSGRLLCQSFSACRWVDSAAAFPARLLGIFFASPSAVIFLRQPFQVTFPSKSPGRLSANLSRPPLRHLLRSYRVSCLRFSM